MKLLLDTCVLTELVSNKGDAKVRAFVQSADRQDVYLSVITIGEIRRGVQLLPTGKRKTQLNDWLVRLQSEYRDRILFVDIEVASVWGEITADAKRRGFQLPAMDALIAATAIRHGLHVVTRNATDFAQSGARVVNPWDGAF